MIVVTGCGRSGTGYMSALLRALGRDIGHEQWGRDGISAFQVSHPKHRANYEWDKHITEPPVVVHIVRHPLRVISSWMGRPDTLLGMLDGAEQWAPLERCARYWLEWNQLVEREFPAAWRCQVEHVHEDGFVALCARVGITGWDRAKADAVPRNWGTAHASVKTHGTHRYEHVYTWSELYDRVPSTLVYAIARQAARYGYPTWEMR